MAVQNIKKDLRLKRQRNYLAKDFDSFRNEFLRYARAYFPDKIQDFSEASVGGMLLDLVAFVGDSTSFYLDHQFNELGLDTAVERRNVERLIRLAGVKIKGASPAFCNISFTLTVDSELTSDGYAPMSSQLPILKPGTKVNSNVGVSFILRNDLDFSEKNESGKYLYTSTIDTSDANGNPLTYKITRTGLCESGQVAEEKFSFGSDITPFKTITLSNSNVNEILIVKDSEGNEYFEVDDLSQDTVFKEVENYGTDSSSVESAIAVVPAPYRFSTRVEADSGVTTLVFGSGFSETLDNDILPDPSEVSLPLYGDKKVFSKISIDPGSLIGSKSLGINPINTTIRVRYKYGGGISNNIAANSVRQVTNLVTKFSAGLSPSKISTIRSSISVDNPSAAQGGENAPTLEALRTVALSVRNSQNRVVTKDDLIARIFLMPTNFGRAFRVGIQPNPINPLSSIIYVINRDQDGKLVQSPDTLKRNLSTYINEFRVVSDSFDILDAKIVNIGFNYSVVIDDREDKEGILIKINNSIIEYLKTENMNIDGGILISDIINIILNQDGVISLDQYEFTSLTGTIDDRTYSSFSIKTKNSIRRGVLSPPVGGIFEVKYPDSDIVGSAT